MHEGNRGVDLAHAKVGRASDVPDAMSPYQRKGRLHGGIRAGGQRSSDAKDLPGAGDKNRERRDPELKAAVSRAGEKRRLFVGDLLAGRSLRR